MPLRGPRAWVVSAANVVANNYNLDVKNPSRAEYFEHMPSEKLAADIAAKERRIGEIMSEIQTLLAGPQSSPP